MILCISCDCGGAEPLIRRALQESGYKNWLTEPIYRGKSETSRVLEQVFGDRFFEINALKQYLKTSSSYAIVIGANDKQAIWADLGRGDIKSKMDAISIVDAFAE